MLEKLQKSTELKEKRVRKTCVINEFWEDGDTGKRSLRILKEHLRKRVLIMRVGYQC